MQKVVVDAELRKKLHNLTESLELRDEEGHLVGYVTPVVDKSLYDQVKSPLSEEELQKRMQEKGGRPLEDILRDLENKT